MNTRNSLLGQNQEGGFSPDLPRGWQGSKDPATGAILECTLPGIVIKLGLEHKYAEMECA